ncbi:hypothetical protein N866_11170 [Actinotalea ferrariae CF5-4]|uniref:Uncharacterized protein n=1 Tax=Actinotalea ferrariae CF5-4 TaxID=948458 RepID=A0A021VQ39_9CELL|nr:hypothetical protein [Actinotalea ferrariae]EYR62160.1 hypothetical protein N866_11170 [Actinotalea ferrariae CF5-4]
MTAEPETHDYSVRVTWPVDAAADALPVNQVAVLQGADTEFGPEGSVYLVLGHVAPPLIPDPLAAERFFTSGEASLDVRVRAAVYLTRPRAMELYRSLGQQLEIMNSRATGEPTGGTA